MKIRVGEYLIESNKEDLCLTVFRIDSVTSHRLSKEENIGKERKVLIGYPSTLHSAVKIICQRVLIENDELDIILDKLSVIQREIEAISKKMNIQV